jgi:hypothetical protein
MTARDQEEEHRGRGWVAPPDVKITRVDDPAATLAGGYVCC